MMRTGTVVACSAAAVLVAVAAGPIEPGRVAASSQQKVLRLATTTSTVDTGLLADILPDFQARCGCRVDVVAVGTGQAIELGKRGDADVLLVHSPEQEAAFMKEGHGIRRDDVMYNDFVIVGPTGDPAGVAKASSARDAFRSIARAAAAFASRGDRSGTHTKERAIWKSAGIDPAEEGPQRPSWYLSVGQGMGETLAFANEKQAYALADRATWTSMQGRLPSLRRLFGGGSGDENPDRDLRNQYSVIVIDQARHPGVKAALGLQFADWLLSKPTQARIAAFGRDSAGRSLFYADSDEYKATDRVRVESGGRSRTFTLGEIAKLRSTTLSGVEYIGVKKGRLGRHAWTGVSLTDLLLALDPGIASKSRSTSTIEVVSSDGWTASFTWHELFGSVSRGEGLYRAKGCNECHGLKAEGTRPEGKRPAPKLLGETYPVGDTTAMIRSGTAQHEGITAYTADRLSDADLAAILGWLARPNQAGTDDVFVVPPPRRIAMLAYERDGRPMTGRDGLIQLVVGFDEFASRYSHWVSEIRVRY
ncbi:MAG TPA: substrate-binding domain-containing protein [Vicinamibacterales bacterium]|nr:substrate-binding domain-containing protein [Vicinamibacterales bacterium]HPW20073.1 substrate-binding domain-containing protein [Vicinamibacterales bacterium]